MSSHKFTTLSFLYENHQYESEWRLLNIEQSTKAKEKSSIGNKWRIFTEGLVLNSYNLRLSSIIRNNDAYELLIRIKDSQTPYLFQIKIGKRLYLEGMFLITTINIEENRYSLLHMKITLESHGEIKNVYSK